MIANAFNYVCIVKHRLMAKCCQEVQQNNISSSNNKETILLYQKNIICHFYIFFTYYRFQFLVNQSIGFLVG